MNDLDVEPEALVGLGAVSRERYAHVGRRVLHDRFHDSGLGFEQFGTLLEDRVLAQGQCTPQHFQIQNLLLVSEILVPAGTFDPCGPVIVDVLLGYFPVCRGIRAMAGCVA